MKHAGAVVAVEACLQAIKVCSQSTNYFGIILLVRYLPRILGHLRLLAAHNPHCPLGKPTLAVTVCAPTPTTTFVGWPGNVGKPEVGGQQQQRQQ